MKLVVTRLFSKSYKKTHSLKHPAQRMWGLAKETTFSSLLETDFLKLLKISLVVTKKPQIPSCFTDHSSLWFVF